MVTLFGILLLVIFVVEIAGGVTAYVYKGQLEGFLKDNMKKSIGNNKTDSEAVWDDMQKEGCYTELRERIKSKIALVGGVAIGIGVVELIGVMFAFCLAAAIRKEYEGV